MTQTTTRPRPTIVVLAAMLGLCIRALFVYGVALFRYVRWRIFHTSSPTSMEQVWIAGRVSMPGVEAVANWEVLGVYSSRAAAVTRCEIAEHDFVAAVNVDEDTSDNQRCFPDAVYPLATSIAAESAT